MQIIGVDIGGTYIRSGIVNSNGKIISKVRLLTHAEKGKKSVLDNIVHSIRDIYNKKVSGIGVGFPGPIDDKGNILNPPNVPFKNFNIKDYLKKKFKLPIKVDNDANCFALAESLYGAAKNYKYVVGITIGTGVGAGIVINKKIYHGRNYAGEFGHSTINFKGPRCKCGNLGCVESYISARAIVNRVKSLNVETPKDVYILANKGNKIAINALRETGYYLGIGLGNIINILDPEIIVLGGQIIKAWKFIMPEAKKSVKEWAMFKGTKIVKKQLENSGIVGASSLFLSLFV